MSDFKVKIPYKNENLETVVEKQYDFIDYAILISDDLKKILGNIEFAFYSFNDNKPKDQWTPESMGLFKNIRHKMLDQVNAIRRLPETLSYKNVPANTMNFSEFLARSLK